MKKRMRIAAMLAGVGMLIGALPAVPVSAQIWELVGAEAGESFQDMIPLDDKGLFNLSGGECNYQVYMQYYTDYYDDEVTDPITGEVRIERVFKDSCHVYVVSPIPDTLWFVLRSDQPDAEQKMLEILDRYYPELSSSYSLRKPNDYARLIPDPINARYELHDLTEYAGSAERSDSIMHDLADASLISEFYTWGQGAYYQQYNGWAGYIEDGFDKETVERYLTEHALNCTVAEHVHKAEFPNEVLTWKDYELVPGEDMSFAELFAVAAGLYESTGIRPAFGMLDAVGQTFGRNSLAEDEIAVSGDVDCNGAVQIADAVLLARYLAEDNVLITAQGLQNAELDGNAESLDAGDFTRLLQMIAGAGDGDMQSMLIPVDYSVNGLGGGEPDEADPFLTEFFELPLNRIEEQYHAQALLPKGEISSICVSMTHAQLEKLMAELEPQREAIGKDAFRFKKAFFGILLEKLHLTGIYNTFNWDYWQTDLPSAWLEKQYPFTLGEADELDEDALCYVVLRYHPPTIGNDTYSLEHAGQRIAVSLKEPEKIPDAVYELAVRSLYVINKYGDKAYFTDAFSEQFCFSAERAVSASNAVSL